VADKQESQDICFIETNYRNFLLERTGIHEKSGPIRHSDGQILGEHRGIFNYTIGQRRGLGISYRTPLFVSSVDLGTNTVYVSDCNSLYSNRVDIVNINYLVDRVDENKEYGVKLRSASQEQRGLIKFTAQGATVTLLESTRAVTPGQLCCLYEDDRVVCSGWIV
jgi:tRNA-specific 2-thiouridylase